MEGSDGKVIKEDVFQCLSRKEKYYRLVLTSSEILLQLQGGNGSHQTFERYSINDLFGCHTLRHKEKGFSSAYVCFYLYPKRRRVLLNKAKIRERVPLVFEVRKGGNSYEENLKVATKWKEETLKVLQRRFPKWEGIAGEGEGEGRIGEFTVPVNFTRRYLVVVNPVSGQGKGVPTFHERIHPVFMESGVKVNLLITERPGHASDIVSSMEFSDVDGIITVGGDGLLYEVVNGLRSRADAERIAKLPVGVIATGSGNGLARSLAHYGGEDLDYLKNPVLTTTLAAARGKVVPVNLLEVDLDGKPLSAFLSVGWGLLADIDVESEVLRAIGEPRFTVWGLLRLAKLRSYKAELSYIPSEIGVEDKGGNPFTLEGDFISVYSSCQSFIGSDMIFAPEAKPGDGLIHLTFLKKDAGRASATQFLLGIEKGSHLNTRGVTYVTVKEFCIRSPEGIPGAVTVDGEKVEGKEIRVRVSPRPLYVFSLGG